MFRLKTLRDQAHPAIKAKPKRIAHFKAYDDSKCGTVMQVVVSRMNTAFDLC